MNKLTALRNYTTAYYSATNQLHTSRIARTWMEAGIPAEQAAEWANAGFTPEEALPLIGDGMTPALASAADPTTEQERMERLADRMRMLRD